MAYSDLPSPTLVNGKIVFTAPGSGNRTLSVRRKASGGNPAGTPATVTITPGTTQLAAPGSLSFVATSASTGDVDFDNVSHNSGYTVQYANNNTFTGASTVQLGADATTVTLTGLSATTQYYVRVLTKGTGSYSNSPYSAAVSDTTPNALRSVMTADSVVVGDSMSKQNPGYLGFTPWAVRHATRLGITLPDANNLSVAGAGSRKVTQRYMAERTRGLNATMNDMVGFNNYRLTTDPTPRIAADVCSRRARLAVHWAERIITPFSGTADSNGANFSLGGGATVLAAFGAVTGNTVDSLLDWGSCTVWSRNNDPANGYANAFLRPSVTAGEKISIPFHGANVALLTFGCAGTELSRFSYTIDGGAATTYDPSGRTDTANIYETNYRAVTNDAIFLLGLGDSDHTLELTYLDSGRIGVWDGLAILKDAAACEPRRVYLFDVPLLENGTDIGYNYPGYLTARTGLVAATAARWNDTAALRAAGYPIEQVHFTHYLPESNSAQVYMDGIHPNDTGHIAIEADLQAVESAPL